MQNQKKIVVLIGASATGKDTIKEKMIKTGNYKQVVSYTTRPKRPEEIDGVHYNFISDNEMDEILNSEDKLEFTEYLVDGKRFRYSLTKKCFKEDEDNVVIINPIGLKEIVKNNPEIIKDMIIIHLTCYRALVEKRYMEREANEADKEALRRRFEDRIKRDIQDFKGFEDFLKENNFTYKTFLNLDSEKTFEEIKKYLFELNPIGKKIRIVEMKGEPQYNDKIGIVRMKDDCGQLHGTWGGLAIIPEEDAFEIL